MRWWRRFQTWRVMRKQPRLVRVHMHGDDPSITGFLLGRWDGHYVLALSKMHPEPADGSFEIPAPVKLEGEISVPVGNVYIVQALVGVAGS